MKFFVRFVAWIDRVWLFAQAVKRGFRQIQVVPGTSPHGPDIERLGIEGIDWPQFTALAHSFWRAQELTLFRRHARFFDEPAMDLGCGDAVFGKLAGFPRHTVGVDYDFGSLREAATLMPHWRFARADSSHLPLPDDCCAVVLSNSVLEHLPDLNRALSEVQRCLKPGGRFLCTMTLGEFSEQLRRLCGDHDAQHWLRLFGHVQQPPADTVLAALAKSGLHLERALAYQPESITLLYRLMISPVFQFLERNLNLSRSKRFQHWLGRRLRPTLDSTAIGQGACLFFVASKRA